MLVPIPDNMAQLLHLVTTVSVSSVYDIGLNGYGIERLMTVF